jgi:hypothetical protein
MILLNSTRYLAPACQTGASCQNDGFFMGSEGASCLYRTVRHELGMLFLTDPADTFRLYTLHDLQTIVKSEILIETQLLLQDIYAHVNKQIRKTSVYWNLERGR